MLKKTYRLSSVRLDHKKEFKSKNIKFIYAKNNFKYPRFGIIISKKIDQRAVVRNKLKRKLSIAIENIFDKINSGVDVVLIPNKKALEFEQEILNQEVLEVFKKQNLLND